jgi:hypothetical protein
MVLLALMVMLSGSPDAAKGEVQFSALVSPNTWSDIQREAVKSGKHKDNEMSELLSRLILVSRGEDLTSEALKRTVERANNPKGGFGLIDNGGIKRFFSVFILTQYDLNVRLREQEIRIASQIKALNRLESRNQALQIEVSELLEKNAALQKGLSEIERLSIELAKLKEELVRNR